MHRWRTITRAGEDAPRKTIVPTWHRRKRPPPCFRSQPADGFPGGLTVRVDKGIRLGDLCYSRDRLMNSPIQRRKDDHLDLCATDDVAFRGATNLLEKVQLVHQSLPDFSVDAIDTSTTLLGKTLRRRS